MINDVLDFIILNYNDFRTTINLINEIHDYKCIDHIIVVDNLSSDNSYEKLKENSDNKVIVISTEKNKGYAAGNNFGAYYAMEQYRTKYLAFANPDIHIDEYTLNDLLNCIQNIHNVGELTCVMDCKSNVDLPIASKLPSFIDCICENFIIAKKIIGDRLSYSRDYIYHNKLVKVDVLPGSFFIIKSDVFSEIKGFDESTFLYYEENILAFKLIRKGYQNYLMSNREYLHDHSTSIDKSISRAKDKLEIANNSRLIYCEKYLELPKIKLDIVNITFRIGLFNYLLAKKCHNMFKRR